MVCDGDGGGDGGNGSGDCGDGAGDDGGKATATAAMAKAAMAKATMASRCGFLGLLNKNSVEAMGSRLHVKPKEMSL